MPYNIRPETFSIIHIFASRLSFPMPLAISHFFTHIYQLAIFGSLSKGGFEQRTSTGGVLFAFFGNGFVHIFEQLVSTRIKKPSNTNLVASRCNKISSRTPECVVW